MNFEKSQTKFKKDFNEEKQHRKELRKLEQDERINSAGWQSNGGRGIWQYEFVHGPE
jgi:hypothetical protein